MQGTSRNRLVNQDMRTSDHLSKAACCKLENLIAQLADECILRIRRRTLCWEGSNRALAAPASDAPKTRAFRTASVTKTFTAALVFLLVEDGRLHLDDRLSTYLSRDICEQIHVLEGEAFGSNITIAQLLRHRSGVFDYATSAQFFQHVLRDPSKQWLPMDFLIEAMQGGAPYFRPGEGLAYSDTGYVLLAMIIEVVTGEALAVVYRERLLKPLGLNYTFLEGQELPVDWPVSHAFDGTVDTACFNPSFDTCGGGGLVSTASDLDLFITNLLHGSVFSRDESLRSMMAGTNAPAGSGTRKTRTAAGLSEFSIVDHFFWGHLGHWNSFMLHAIDEDLSICGTFNQAKDHPLQMRILEAAATEALSWDL